MGTDHEDEAQFIESGDTPTPNPDFVDEEEANEDDGEDPFETLKAIVAENPGATKEQIRRLFRDECLSDEKLRDAVARQVFNTIYREEMKRRNN